MGEGKRFSIRPFLAISAIGFELLSDIVYGLAMTSFNPYSMGSYT
jgi:hypothetical protein